MLHPRPLTWILLIMGPFTFLAKIQPQNDESVQRKTGLSPSSLLFDVQRWPCSCSVTTAHQRLFSASAVFDFKDLTHSVAEFKTADRVSTAASQWCELRGISLWLLGLWGHTVLVDYFFLRAPGDLHKALMRKENRSKRKATPRQRLVFACDGLPHCWKATFFFFSPSWTAFSNTFICSGTNNSY